MKVTLEKSKWERNVLCGKMYDPGSCRFCIMGFVALACGYPVEDLIGISERIDLPDYGISLDCALQKSADHRLSIEELDELETLLIEANDFVDDKILDSRRIERFIELLKPFGVELEVVE